MPDGYVGITNAAYTLRSAYDLLGVSERANADLARAIERIRAAAEHPDVFTDDDFGLEFHNKYYESTADGRFADAVLDRVAKVADAMPSRAEFVVDSVTAYVSTDEGNAQLFDAVAPVTVELRQQSDT